MRVLLLSYYFPPYNTIGALRVGKFAKYLTESGNDVMVVAARNPAVEQQDTSLNVEIDPSKVVYTRWWDVNGGVRGLAGLVQRSRSKQSAAVMPSLDSLSGRLQSFSKLYLSLVNIPDAFWGWQRHALNASLEIARSHHPEILLASGPPFSAFQSAARLSRRLDIPWVADFRDLWSDKLPYPFQEWRRRVDLFLEKRAMRTASGFVSVSAPLIDVLATRYQGLSSELVLNGFDPADFRPDLAPDPGLPLIMRYTGTLFYVGNNDPTVLFAALRSLGEERVNVRAEFIVRDFAPRIVEMARESGVSDCVHVLPPVPYRQSLELQQRSDVLMLIVPGRGDPSWDGVFGGKFFEYCGTGRPILAVAGSSNVAARAVREHELGLASTDPLEIANWLRERIAEKRASTGIAGLDPKRVRAFTRRAQTERLEAFLMARLGCAKPDGQHA